MTLTVSDALFDYPKLSYVFQVQNDFITKQGRQVRIVERD